MESVALKGRMTGKIILTDQLRDYIARLGPDQARLPAERQLADELNVSRTALRKALDQLEAEGCVYRHVGKGTFVTRRSTNEVPTLQLISEITNPLDVMEVRLILEPRAARLAAMRITAAELAAIERCIVRGEASTDITSYELWDGRFHIEVATASHNQLLSALLTIVQATRDSQIWGSVKEKSLSSKLKNRYTSEHKKILSALRDRDADLAESLMRQHLSGVSKTIQAALEAG